MKKKLEADLISIAHRVLQIKNKSDVNLLLLETRKLYEKLTILNFVEEHFEGVKPTIGKAETVAKMNQFFDESQLNDLQQVAVKPEPVIQNSISNDLEEIPIIETLQSTTSASELVELKQTESFEEVGQELEKEEESADFNEISFQPAFELDMEVEEKMTETKSDQSVQISFEDLLGGDYSDTLFVKLEEAKDANEVSIDFELPKKNEIWEEYAAELGTDAIQSKAVSLNDKLSQGLTIDLNDRIGFVKNLFANSEEDYTRVLNQLITYDNFEEAKDFILEMVKPDYEDWVGKEQYEQRFIEIVEKKFSNG